MEKRFEKEQDWALPVSTSAIGHRILFQTQNKMGRIPPMYLGMSHNPALLDTYVYSDQSFRENAGFTALEQEIIYLSISVENGCEYCVAAHSFLADKMAHARHDIINAIRTSTEIGDPKLKVLSLFTRAVVAKRGYPSNEELDAFYEAGYSATDVLGVIAAIGIQTFSNYYNHIFPTVVDKKYMEWVWKK